MKILFGMNLDGVAWSSAQASLGEVRTGPLGLLNILETRLGLSRTTVHPVHRINQYLQRLKALDQESTWFHASFTADPWSTARQLLEWRDELVEAGWQGQTLEQPASPRLATLAQLENLDLELAAGRADRLREVMAFLQQHHSTDISACTLMEPMELLPPIWRSLFARLAQLGIEISIKSPAEQQDPDSNLAVIQAISRGNVIQKPLNPQDDSLILLKADNEWQAAEHLALWLAADQAANHQVTIICGTDTSILDQALSRHGLPRLGRAQPSRWREIQQILPLVLANAWQPVDIRLLVELLSLSSSPLPRWVCRFLLKAIAEEPGVGGEAWQKALTSIADKRKQDLADQGDLNAETHARAFAQDIHAWLVDDRYDSAAGIPELKLREKCQKVVDWLSWQLESEPLFVEAVSQSRKMQKLSFGQGSIPRITLERMLDSVIGVGSTTAESFEEVGPWQVVDHPGQIVERCQELVWWGFNDPATGSPTFWSEQERAALSHAGVELEQSAVHRQREAAVWQQALCMADRRLIAIYIGQIDGEEAHHPFWDAVLNAGAKADIACPEDVVQRCLVKNINDFAHRQDWFFAGRSKTLTEVQTIVPHPVTAMHAVPAAVIPPPARLSYSQMSTLIGCPLKWALEYYADLQLPESRVIPTGNQMIGTFCHRIIEELYHDGRQWAADEASRAAGDLFDQYVPALASELLLEGNAIERQRYRAAIVRAIRQLTEAINARQLRVEATEASLTAALQDIPFIGFADLLLRDAAGHRFVLDLKWSTSSKYRKQEIENGIALQLATYAWLLRAVDPAEDVHTGYFMLAQGRLLSDSPVLSDEAIESPHTLEEIWDRGVASMQTVQDQFAEGNLEARGVQEQQLASETNVKVEKVRENMLQESRAAGLLYQSPPCKFCDFGVLCGKAGGG